MVALVVILAAITAGVSTGAVASEATDRASLGASVSSFMQASEAEANATVDSGLYVAKLNDSNESERARLIRQRIEQLRVRLAALEEDRNAFDPRADGNVTVPERARAAQLAVRADRLVSAINETEAQARRAGIPVNETKLDLLRNEARNMTGQQVATVATGLVDIDRPDQARGPPDQPGNRSDNANRNTPNSGTNSSDGQSDDRGRSGDASSGNSDGSDRGNSSSGSDQGSGQDSDQANGTSGNDRTPAGPGTAVSSP